MQIRTSCISARSISKKLSKEDRPKDSELYRFLEGNLEILDKKTRAKMVKILDADYKEFRAHLLK